MKESRLLRIIENMEKLGFDQILVSATPSIYYLTGLWVHPGERLLALTIDRKDGCTLYVNRMFALQPDGFKLVEFDDTDDSVHCLAGGLKPGVLGVDKTWPSGFAVRLMEKRPDIRLALGSAPVDDARMMKDEEELCAMRKSSLLNDRCTGELIRKLRVGQTEREVGRMYMDLVNTYGAQDTSFSPLICFGPNCAEPHHDTDGTVMKSGDAVILDVGASLNRAASDMTRTVFIHSATDEQRRVYDIVKTANLRAIATVRPGIKLSEIDRAARAFIEDAGYGDRFLHRTGHGIGMECHEPPDVSATSDIIARPGMVFSIEPGIYLPGRFGVRVEDLVAVTEDGCEVLNKLPKELMIVE